jgi:hypothetical protein
MKPVCCLGLALLASPILQAQEFTRVQPAGTVRNALVSKSHGVAREIGAAARDFATFRDPRWSLLTMAQIGASSADGVTSLNNLHSCTCFSETGLTRFVVGQHPDAHKYFIAGMLEIGTEAVSAHYFRRYAPSRKWYWRALSSLPQSISLYEHTWASYHNTQIALSCRPPGLQCR